MKIELGVGEESLLRAAPWSEYSTQVDDIGAQGIVALRSAGVELRVAGKIGVFVSTATRAILG